MGRENRIVGKAGERAASNYLKGKGYRILEMNLRTPFGELDMIAMDRGFIVFIEVKSRITDSLGPPLLSVTRAKKRHIVKNAFSYLKRRGLVDSLWRIDVLSVRLNYDLTVRDIELIENAVTEEDLI